MSSIYFTKMHGLGNDFMVVDSVHQSFQPDQKTICALANRHTGIGFDQLSMIEPAPDPSVDFFYRIFNADGSEAEQCGNGARCIARFIHDKNLSALEHLKVATKAGILELYFNPDGQIRVNMGVPHYKKIGTPFETPIGKIPINIISLGNPHCVIEVPDIQKAPVSELGTYMATHAYFSEGTNVGFMQIENTKQINLRVYERGAGETLGCGSGACAAVVAGRLLGQLDEQVTVTLPGGTLSISWIGENEPIWMTGSAITVFEGSLSLSSLNREKK